MEEKEIPINLKNNYILIEDIEDEMTTPSNINIPGSNNDNFNRFSRVVKVCDDCTCNLQPGDIIIKPINRESKIKLNGKLYGVLNSNLIFAKIIE